MTMTIVLLQNDDDNNNTTNTTTNNDDGTMTILLLLLLLLLLHYILLLHTNQPVRMSTRQRERGGCVRRITLIVTRGVHGKKQKQGED